MRQEILQIKKTKDKRSSKINVSFLLLLLTLLFFGTLMIFSASFPYAKVHYGDGFYYIKRSTRFFPGWTVHAPS